MFSIIKDYIILKKLSTKKNLIIIRKPFHIEFEDNIRIGKYVYINRGCRLNGMGGIIIGNNVIIGPDVLLWSADHNYDSDKFIPYDSEVIKKEIIIEDNVWIGAHAKILPGVKIEEGAIIGLGAVVTKNVPRCAIVGGNPAKIIKFRDMEKYDRLKQEGKLYLKYKYEKKIQIRGNEVNSNGNSNIAQRMCNERKEH